MRFAAGDAAPSILFVANAREDTGPRKCDVIDIYEKEDGAGRQLGRFVYGWRDHKLHPNPRKPGPGRFWPRYNLSIANP